MTRSTLATLAVLIFMATAAPAQDAPKPEDPAAPIHHGLVQKKIGFYAVYLPPDYEAKPEKSYPVCLILHGSGSTETGHGALSNAFGREGVIYVAPRAPHAAEDLFIEEGRPGWTAWPTYPMEWGEWDSPGFPQEEMKRLDVQRLYTDWIADCLVDARRRYRIDDQRAVVVGHSQGAAFAHLFALHRPELVRAYLSYAGYFDDSIGDEIAALTLKKRGIFPVIVHSEGDPVVDPAQSRRLDEYLTRLDVPHETLILPAGDHLITSKVNRRMQEFVAKRCRGEELPPLKGELLVTEIVPDSQAAAIGLAAGDVLVSYDGKPLANIDDLRAAIAAAGAREEGAEPPVVTIAWRRGEAGMSSELEVGTIGVMLADR